MKRTIYSLFFLLFAFSSLLAQEVDVDVLVVEEEETTPITLSGSVDTYFRYNITSPNRRSGDGAIVAPATSFANLPGFSLGMVNLIAGYEGENVGFVGDLVFGPRGTEAVFEAGTASSTIVNQLYVYWNASDAITLTLGNFNTFLGYEVISPAGNFNYSTSYMFSYGPFSHTGLKADFALSDELSFMLAIMNPTDFTDFNPSASYSLGGQLGYSTDAASVYLNLLYGDQDGNFDSNKPFFGGESGAAFQADITAGFDLSDQFYLGLNTTYKTTGVGDVVDENGVDLEDAAGFGGAALYLQVSPSESFALGLRGEYFTEFGAGDSPNGVDFVPSPIGVGAIPVDISGDGNVLAFTLSGNVEIAEGLTLIPEFRLDAHSEDVAYPNRDFDFGDLDNVNNLGNSQSSLLSFLFAAVYSF